MKLVDKFNTPYMAVAIEQKPDISDCRPIYTRIDREYITLYIAPDGLSNFFCYHEKWYLMPPFSQGMELIRYLTPSMRGGNFYTEPPARRSKRAWDFRIDRLCDASDLWDDTLYCAMFYTIIDEMQACHFPIDNIALLKSWYAKIQRPGKRKILAHENYPQTEDDSCFFAFFDTMWKKDRARLWKIVFGALPKSRQKMFLTENFHFYETAKKIIQSRHAAYWKSFVCPIVKKAPEMPLPAFCIRCSERRQAGQRSVCLLRYAVLRGASVHFPVSSLLGKRKVFWNKIQV